VHTGLRQVCGEKNRFDGFEHIFSPFLCCGFIQFQQKSAMFSSLHSFQPAPAIFAYYRRPGNDVNKAGQGNLILSDMLLFINFFSKATDTIS
jgi:hypothetical protein